MIFIQDGFVKVSPVGPFKVMEDDEDGTYEVFDIGMAKIYGGLPPCNVWVICTEKLRVGKTYHGKLDMDTPSKFPVLTLDKVRRNR